MPNKKPIIRIMLDEPVVTVAGESYIHRFSKEFSRRYPLHVGSYAMQGLRRNIMSSLETLLPKTNDRR